MSNKKAHTNIQRVIFALFVLSLLFVFSPVQAATINAVQSGTATSSGNGTTSISITAVDPSKSFLMFQTRSSSNRPPGSTVRGRLNAAGTAVEFVRVTNETSTINIQWYVVEFTSGVSVQRGEVDQTANTLNVSIAAVSSTSQAFVLFSKTPRNTDSIWSSDDPTAGRLTSTSNVQFKATNGNGSHRIAWQVIEFTNAADINVQTGSSTTLNNGGTGSVNITLPTAVNTANSFALVGFHSRDSGPDVGERMIRAQLINSTTLRIDRGATGDHIDEIVWQVVELKDGSTVQHGSESLNNGDAQNAIAITVVDTSRSVAFASVQAYSGQNMGMNDYLGDDVLGVSSVTLGLSSTSIDMRRNFTGGQADVGWFVVEFNNVPAVMLPAAVGEWRMDETSWNGTAGEVLDSSVNGLNGVRMGTSVTPTLAKVCNGAALAGSTDFVEIADNALLDISDKLTVMTWIKPDSIPGGGLMTILSKDENYEFHINSSANINWWWRNSGNGTRQFNSSGVTLTPGTWYHIAIVYDNSGSQKIYIDGVERGSRTYAENLINNNDPLQFGADQGFAGREFDGMIDEVRVYNDAFSAAQVAAAMAETRPCPSTPPPVVCTVTTIPGAGDLNSISGSSINNVVAVGNNGQIFRYDGTNWVAETSPGEDFNAVSVIDANTAVAVGENGRIAIYSGGTWISSNSGTGQDLLNVWAYSSTDIYAVGDNGVLLYFNGTNWTDVSSAAGTGGNEIVGVWGDSSAFYALSEDGDLYRYDRSAGTWSTISTCASVVTDDTNALWGDAAGNIYIAGDGGAIYRYDGTSCSLVATSSEDLNGISGSTTTGEIYAVGENGTVLYFDGSSWTESTVGTQNYNSVWVSAGGVPFYAGDNGSTVTCTSTSSLGYFLIGHDQQGLHCLPEIISVTAKKSDGSTYTAYTGSIVLDTQSGSGSWTLNTGTVANFADATANDGLATYSFDATDNGVAIFNLDYRSGTASIDVDAYDGTTRDNDTEGNLVFSASGFTVTAAPLAVPFLGAVNTTIPPQVSASDFPLYLAAYGITPTDPSCGIIETYTGNKNLKFWSTYNNPTSGTLPVQVNTVNAFANEVAANTGSTQTVTFSNGQAVITVNYADVGQITLAMKDDTLTADLPAGIRGVSDAFVVKPADFVLDLIVGNPGTATDENAALFVAAGSNFPVTVTAVNSLGNATPNYGQENVAESVLLTPDIVAPLAGNNPPVTGVGDTGFDGLFVNGVATGTDFHWDNVGIITLTPGVADGDYLGAGDVTGTVSPNVGRFYPSHFTTTTSDGSFANACVTGMAFTYLGESFGYLGSPALTATAQSAVNTTTSNYTGAWARLGIGGVSLTYPAADNSQLDENGSLAIAVVSTAGMLSRIDNANGSLTFTLGGASADSFAYVRDVGQVAPFTSDLTIALTSVDDGEASANDTPRNINPIGNLQRFGRGYAQDVYGTMSLVGDSLTLPIGSWYFNASSTWTLNTDDSCSSYTYSKVDTSIAATAVPASASAVTLSSGVGDLTLTLTNAGNPGGSSVVTTVWPAWLQFDYDGVDQLSDGNFYDDNPSATATFGIFRGDDRYLYWREAP